MSPEFSRLLSDIEALLKQIVSLLYTMRTLYAWLFGAFVWNACLWFFYARQFRRTNALLGELPSLHTKLLEVLEREER